MNGTEDGDQVRRPGTIYRIERAQPEKGTAEGLFLSLRPNALQGFLPRTNKTRILRNRNYNSGRAANSLTENESLMNFHAAHAYLRYEILPESVTLCFPNYLRNKNLGRMG